MKLAKAARIFCNIVHLALANAEARKDGDCYDACLEEAERTLPIGSKDACQEDARQE